MSVENIAKFKTAVKKAHEFSDALLTPGQNSVTREAIEKYSDLSSMEIYYTALALQEKGELIISKENPEVYILQPNF